MDLEKAQTAELQQEDSAIHKVTSAIASTTVATAPVEPAAPLANAVSRDEPPPVYPGKAKLALIMAAIYTCVFLIALDRTIIGVVIPKITDEFHSINDIGWYGSSYQMTMAAFILPFGRLYTFCSTKWTFMSGILIFEVGSAVCGAAPSSTAFIIGRAIAGFGSSGIFTGAIGIMVKSVPLHRRPVLQGLFGACFAIASVAGPLIGGAFSQSSLTWRWAFYINLPLGGATIIALFFFLHLQETKPPISWKDLFLKLDPLGNIFFLPAIVCLVLALQWGGVTYAWSNGRVIGLLVAFSVCTITWLSIQYLLRHSYATVPSKIFLNRAVLSGAWFQFVMGATFIVVVLYMPLWFQAIKGVSPVKAGIDSIPMILALVTASISSGALVARFGYYNPFLYTCAILVPIGAGLLTTLQTDSGHAKWIGYQVLFGFGLGAGIQQSNLAVQTCLKDRDVPTGIAVIFFFQTLGGSIMGAVSQNIFIDHFVSMLRNIPGVPADQVARIGATQIRSLVSAQVLPEVIAAYNHALTHGPFLVATITACLAIFGAISMEWRSVKSKKAAQMANTPGRKGSKDLEAGQQSTTEEREAVEEHEPELKKQHQGDGHSVHTASSGSSVVKADRV